MEINQTVLQSLSTPLSWFVYELLAATLFIAVLLDLKGKKVRTIEYLGFILYGILFENLGVISNVYDYSLHRFLLAGVVPLTIPIFEATIFYIATKFGEETKSPWWVVPFIAAFFGMMQDFTLDPVAVADLHSFGTITEGRWNWRNVYDGSFFGIPYFNFTGWFSIMFFYTLFVSYGRRWYKNDLKKAIPYILISAIMGVITIISPLNLFLLFAYPLFPIYGQIVPELVMLIIVGLTTTYIVIKNVKGKFKSKIVVVVPILLHALDVVIALSLGVWNIALTIVLISAIHLIYLRNKMVNPIV